MERNKIVFIVTFLSIGIIAAIVTAAVLYHKAQSNSASIGDNNSNVQVTNSNQFTLEFATWKGKVGQMESIGLLAIGIVILAYFSHCCHFWSVIHPKIRRENDCKREETLLLKSLEKVMVSKGFIAPRHTLCRDKGRSFPHSLLSIPAEELEQNVEMSNI